MPTDQFVCLFLFETGPGCAGQAGLKRTLEPRLTQASHTQPPSDSPSWDSGFATAPDF